MAGLEKDRGKALQRESDMRRKASSPEPARTEEKDHSKDGFSHHSQLAGTYVPKKVSDTRTGRKVDAGIAPPGSHQPADAFRVTDLSYSLATGLLSAPLRTSPPALRHLPPAYDELSAQEHHAMTEAAAEIYPQAFRSAQKRGDINPSRLETFENERCRSPATKPRHQPKFTRGQGHYERRKVVAIPQSCHLSDTCAHIREPAVIMCGGLVLGYQCPCKAPHPFNSNYSELPIAASDFHKISRGHSPVRFVDSGAYDWCEQYWGFSLLCHQLRCQLQGPALSQWHKLQANHNAFNCIVEQEKLQRLLKQSRDDAVATLNTAAATERTTEVETATTIQRSTSQAMTNITNSHGLVFDNEQLKRVETLLEECYKIAAEIESQANVQQQTKRQKEEGEATETEPVPEVPTEEAVDEGSSSRL
ncbi:hypothetical protein QBC35DRAFT_476030 [Podospora australis]|uniref:Uncharacterized protein n=1 Tax=Podospora australis TaxID=1536484 RepID=A0AAN6WPK1_9PEZI|nr:hypothetical protein QBC35DRAFT_476030 [Podospora australis]